MKKFNLGSQDRFGYQWEKYHKILPEYEKQFLKWVYPLKKNDFKNRVVLDAGCGIGRNLYWPLLYGAKEAVAFDYDKRTVSVAKKNLSKFSNTKIEYGSVYDINYSNYFDIAFSIGVIHHLDRPQKAIKELIKSVKKGGKVLIWVYGYEGNEWIVRYVNPFRILTSKAPLQLVSLVSNAISILLYSYVNTFNQKKPYMKQISKFSFSHINSIVFDQLIPRIANYWKKEEALKLFQNLGLKEIKICRVNENSWTLLATKK